MYLQLLTKQQLEQRIDLMNRVVAMQGDGICPTCDGSIYPSAADRIFHETEHVICLLEQYPRNLGHTIVMVKPHYNDISELPPDLFSQVYATLHHTINKLKDYLQAEKVYLCTMCDGKRNHLHFQLIPRSISDTVRGSQLFVKQRQLLVDYHRDIKILSNMMLNQ